MIAVVDMGAELPERHGTRSGHIEGVHAMSHRDANSLIAPRNSLDLQSRTFGAHEDGMALDIQKRRIVERDGIVGKSHGGARKPRP